MTMPPQWGTGMRYYFNGIQLFMRNTMFIHSIQLNEFQIAVSRFQTANNIVNGDLKSAENDWFLLENRMRN